MKRKKGFTLLEVILTLALTSIIILGAMNLITFTIRGHRATIDEFDIQSNIRIVSQRLNTVVRDSSAVFILHKDNANDLTDEWNYIMLSPEKNRLMSYKWNPAINSHDMNELFPYIDGVNLELELIKDNTMDSDRLLEYNLIVEGSGESRSISSKVESKNSLQVVDRSYLKKGNTLAYRADERLDEVSNSQAVVGMVLDTSGSMKDRMDGNSDVDDGHSDSSRHSRMKLMKQEAIRLLEGLSEYPNVHISINPFNSTGNASERMMNAKQELDTSPGLRSIINELSFGGGTNTGDGIRRAYYKIKSFNEENTTKTNKNFMIILVDGVTTYGSCNKAYYEVKDYINWRGPEIYVRDWWRYRYREYLYMGEAEYTDGWGRVYYNYRYFHYNPNSLEFVDGNQNLETSTFPYLGPNPDDSGRPTGNGQLLDPIGTKYVEYIGNKVKNYKKGTNEEIKVYVIGFSADSDDYGSLEDIAKATTGDTVYYEADSDEALEAIFEAIQKDISDALWHIGGPN